MDFLITPRFNDLRNALYFPTDPLNALLRAEYSDKFGFYQRNFGVYSYMQLTQDLTYRVHYATGTPFMWQPHNNCAWTPTGTLGMDQMEITPCRVKINEQFCYDEFMGSAYSAFLRWSQNPTIGFSAAGQAAVDELARTIVSNATLGARMTLTGGQLHDPTAVTFEAGTPSRIVDAFSRTVGACRGWIELLIETAAATGQTWLDGSYIDAGDISADGKTYTGAVTGDAVALYDKIFSDAPTALTDAVIEGGVGGFGAQFYPLFLVSLSIYRAVDAAYKAQKESATINEPRISRVPFQTSTDRGSRTIYVYAIDDTIVVPISEAAQFDQYITGTSHFAYLTVSGVIQLGGSFANLPVVNESNVAVLLQVSTDAEDYGTHKFLSHALMATAINDTNYIAGDYLYAEP